MGKGGILRIAHLHLARGINPLSTPDDNFIQWEPPSCFNHSPDGLSSLNFDYPLDP